MADVDPGIKSRSRKWGRSRRTKKGSKQVRINNRVAEAPRELLANDGGPYAEEHHGDTLLLDIYQRLGTVEAQNSQILDEQGRVRYDASAIAQDVAEVAQNLALAKQRVDVMEPHVSKMAAFRAQLSLAVLFVTGTITGAINLIAYAIMHTTEIKMAFRELLR